MITCEDCRRAELTPMQRLMEDARAVLGFERRETIWWRSMASMRLMGTALTGQTQYDRHRAEYERTGDTRELQRMLRHVTPPSGS